MINEKLIEDVVKIRAAYKTPSKVCICPSDLEKFYEEIPSMRGADNLWGLRIVLLGEEMKGTYYAE